MATAFIYMYKLFKQFYERNKIYHPIKRKRVFRSRFNVSWFIKVSEYTENHYFQS